MKKMLKITTGFVAQVYEEINGEMVCTEQSFIAGDQVDWENDCGDSVNMPDNHKYQNMEMVQPTRE